MKDAKCLRNEDETIEQLNRLIGSGQALRNGHLEWLSTRTDLMRVFTCCCRLWDSFYEPLLEACSKIKFEKHFDLRMKIERVIDEGVELFHEFHKMVSDRSCEEQKREIVLMDLLLKTGDLLSLKYNLQTPHSLYKTSIKDVMNVYLSIEGSKYQSARALEYEKLSRLLMNERGQPYLLGSVYYGLLSLEMANGSKEVAEDSRKDIKSRIRTLVSDIIVKSGAIEKVEIYVGLQKDSFFTVEMRSQKIQCRLKKTSLNKSDGFVHIFLSDLYSCHETSSGAITAEITRSFCDSIMDAMESGVRRDVEKTVFVMASIMSKCMRGKGEEFHQFMAMSDFCEPILRASLVLSKDKGSEIALAAFGIMADLWIDVGFNDKTMTRDLLEATNDFPDKFDIDFKIETILGPWAVHQVLHDILPLNQTSLKFKIRQIVRCLKVENSGDFIEPIYRLLNIVLDTNAILYDRRKIDEVKRLIDVKCVVPSVVLKELDNLAKKGKTTTQDARESIDWILDHKRKGNLRICYDHEHSRVLSRINDESILDCARFAERRHRYLYKETQTSVLVSNDLNLRNKARADDVAALKPGSLLAFINSVTKLH